jgi:HK97 family phage portal protein
MHVPRIPLAGEPVSSVLASAPHIGPPDEMQVQAFGPEWQFEDWKDPRLAVFVAGGGVTESGAQVNVATALRNPTVFRCVSLISFAIGMLPLHLRVKETKEKADTHPLFRVLHRKPNPWQTAYEFRALMQQRALVEGNSYARIVRSRGAVLYLIPLDPARVRPKQRPDWQVEYEYDQPEGGKITIRPEDMLHLRYGLSADGITGLSLVRQSAEAIGTAIQADNAAARVFRNGMMVGGAISHPSTLGSVALKNLTESLEARYTSAENAGRWMIFEEGMKAEKFGATAAESQMLEMRKHHIEELARPYGVPRPLLGVDDTSWGTGIDVLGQFFVRYALNPWFTAWEQAIERSCFSDAEADTYEAKFNPGALLRGSMKDQADFFAKGLGAGGQQPFLHQDEARDWLDLPKRDDLPPPAGAQKPPPGETSNEPPQAS